MKVIGITGGIGSGKSAVTDLLEKKYHAFLISTDQIAHMLMQKDMVSYKLIVEYFGEGILDQDKEIDRGKLGKLVYDNPDKLILLNSLTHPYVMNYVSKLIEDKRNQNIEILCVETALPIEAGLKDICQEIWYVYASIDIRKKRLMDHRKYSEEKVESIFKQQISEEAYRSMSTYIIYNDGTLEGIKEQIEVLLEK